MCAGSCLSCWPTSAPPRSAHADQAHAAIGEIEHLQRAGILDQPHDVVGDELLGADRHVDGEGAVLVEEQLACACVKSAERMRAMRVASLLNRVQAIWHATMFTSSLLVSATKMSASRAPAASSMLGLRAVADDRADVDAILQVAQQLVVDVDDGDFVRLFAREVIGRRAADLAGAEDDDFHGCD